MIPKTMKGIGIDKEDYSEIFGIINEVKKKNKIRTNSLDPYLRTNSNLFDDIAGKRRRQTTRYEQINKFLKDHLGIDIDTEKFKANRSISFLTTCSSVLRSIRDSNP